MNAWRQRLLAVIIPILLPVCASSKESRPISWEEAEVPTSRSTGSGTKKAAADFYTDDACVAEAERLLSAAPAQAHEFMRGCLHRDDFVLLSRLREQRWKGFKLRRADWPAIMRSELRRGSISELDLTQYGIPSPWLRTAPNAPAPGDMFLLHAEAVEAREWTGKPGYIVHPIIYGSRDEIFEYEQHWDLVHVDRATGRETVVQKDVKITKEREKTGRAVQQAQVVKHPVLLQLDESARFAPGSGLLCIIDKVRAGPRSKDVVYDEEDIGDDDGDTRPLPIRQVVHAVVCVSTNG